MKKSIFLLPILALILFSCKNQNGTKQNQTDNVVEKKEKKQPNIIFIMADDHTSQGIGVYGSRLAKLNPTPTIDRIGNEGIIFENAFCVNAICTPSRASIITGQYGQVNNVRDLQDKLPSQKQYLAHEMKKLGYTTAVVGKWHLKYAPGAFDYFQVLKNQGDFHSPTLISNQGVGATEPAPFDKGDTREVYAKTYTGEHSSDVITDISLDWLENRRDKSKPFMLLHHYKAPHDMFEFAKRYENYLEDTFIPEPASLWDNKNNGSIATKGLNGSLMDTIGSSVGKRNIVRNMGMHMDIDANLSDDEYKRASYQEYLKRYLRCVKGVDDNVKRLFDYLEKNDLMDNTIICYTGDQGFNLGEHDYIDKRWMYDPTMRMPFLVRYPESIKAGTRTDAIINNTDFAPTLIELAGGSAPEYMQGSSFKSILENEGKEPEGWQQDTYYRYWMHMAHKHNNPAHFGIRTKEYKLIFFYARDYKARGKKFALPRMHTPVAWEFYDLRNDPDEMDNKYGDPKYADVITELKARLKQKRTELKEDDSIYPEIQKSIDENWDK